MSLLHHLKKNGSFIRLMVGKIKHWFTIIRKHKQYDHTLTLVQKRFTMSRQKNTSMKIRNLVDLFAILPEDEKIIVDVLRQIIIETLPDYCKEKISYNVPFFYGNKGICIIWPSTVPRGGIKKGVLLGFWYGNKLNDHDRFLSHGTNKQIFYKIYHTPEEIDDEPIIKLLKEAIKLDSTFKKVS
jgi:hypothetical protein